MCNKLCLQDDSYPLQQKCMDTFIMVEDSLPGHYILQVLTARQMLLFPQRNFTCVFYYLVIFTHLCQSTGKWFCAGDQVIRHTRRKWRGGRAADRKVGASSILCSLQASLLDWMMTAGFLSPSVIYTVPTGPQKYWNLIFGFFRTWKVLKLDRGAEKILNLPTVSWKTNSMIE